MSLLNFLPRQTYATPCARFRKVMRLLVLAWLLGGASVTTRAFQIGTAPQGGTYTIFGRIRLPDGKPARKANVFLETSVGLKRETISDEEGQYEFRGMTTGRYRVYATNPEAPEQYSDPAQSDTTRAYAYRVQIDVYLRLPLHKEKSNANPGTVSAAEAAQDIPKAARKAYEQGMRLQKENQTEEALKAFDQAIAAYPDYFQALTERANLMMQRNQLPQAEAEFARSLQLNDKFAPTLRGLGYCQMQQRKFADALANLERAYALEPSAPLTLLLLGYANLSLNRYDEAQQSLEQALKLGPEPAARAHVYLAEIFAQQQKFKEAADEIRAYLKAKPDASDATQLKKLEADWRARSKESRQ